MVYLNRVASFAQSLVLQHSEPLAPFRHQLFARLLVVQLARFFAHAISREAARGQENVGMVITVVTLFAGCVDSHVCGAAVAGHQLARKVHS